jgi:hypothetical protein
MLKWDDRVLFGHSRATTAAQMDQPVILFLTFDPTVDLVHVAEHEVLGTRGARPGPVG